MFTLLIATPPHGEPTAEAQGVVNYSAKIRHLLAKHGDHEKVAQVTLAKVESWRRAKILDHRCLEVAKPSAYPSLSIAGSLGRGSDRKTSDVRPDW